MLKLIKYEYIKWLSHMPNRLGTLFITALYSVVLCYTLANETRLFSDQGEFNYLIRFLESIDLYQQQAWVFPQLGLAYLAIVLGSTLYFVFYSIHLFCAEKQRNGQRFLLTRASRNTILLARIVAIQSLAACCSALLMMITLVLIAWFKQAAYAPLIHQGVVIWFNSLIIVLPLIIFATACALWSASTAASAVMAIVVYLALYGLYQLGAPLLGYGMRLIALGNQIPAQLQVSSWESAALWLLPLLQSGGLLLFSTWAFQRVRA